MRQALLLPKNLYRLILEQCREEVPLEACGIMSGVREQVQTAYPMTNIRRSPVAYRIKEEEQLAAFRELDEHREELVAIYHSHPTTPARPSATDISLAYYPEALYVIVSLAESTPVVQAYRIMDGVATRVPITLTEEAGRWRDVRDWGQERRSVP